MGLIKRAEKGLERQEAYRLVQRNAMSAWKKEDEFRSLVKKDEEISRVLDLDEINSCFNLEESLKNINIIFDRLNYLETKPLM